MGDHDDGAGVVHEEVFQPGDRVVVQMVCGLVQEDNVRFTEQRLSQQHLDLVPNGETCHVLLQKVEGEPQTLQELAGFGFGVPAVHLGELILQLGGEDAVFFGEVLLGVEGVLLLHDVVELAVAHDDGVKDGVFVEGEVVLFEDRHPVLGVDDDFAAGGLQFPGEDPQEGGFARTIGSDDAVAVAFGELQVHIFEKRLAAEAQAEI